MNFLCLFFLYASTEHTITNHCIRSKLPLVVHFLQYKNLRKSYNLGSTFVSGETSQDNINTDSDCSTENINSPAHLHSENSNSNPGDDASWTRDEDKIILETFRREGDKEETYQQIANLLENRSVESVKSRFQRLFNILQEMAAKKVL